MIERIMAIIKVVIIVIAIAVPSVILLRIKDPGKKDYLSMCDKCTELNRNYTSTSRAINLNIIDNFKTNNLGIAYLAGEDDLTFNATWLAQQFGVEFVDKIYYDSLGNFHYHRCVCAERYTCSYGHFWDILFFLKCDENCKKWPNKYMKFVNGEFK